jgi:hypothetical protein
MLPISFFADVFLVFLLATVFLLLRECSAGAGAAKAIGYGTCPKTVNPSGIV